MRLDGKILTIVVVAVLILLGVAARLVMLVPYPKGVFNYRDSPNGRYRAVILNNKTMKFFGQEKNYYEVRVEPALKEYPNQCVFREEIPEALVPQGLDLGSQRAVDNAIRWSRNSRYVTFKVGVKEIESMVPF